MFCCCCCAAELDDDYDDELENACSLMLSDNNIMMLYCDEFVYEEDQCKKLISYLSIFCFFDR